MNKGDRRRYIIVNTITAWVAITCFVISIVFSAYMFFSFERISAKLIMCSLALLVGAVFSTLNAKREKKIESSLAGRAT